MSVAEKNLQDVPMAIIDFETTGLSPKTGARVVEAAVVRIDPGERPRMVVDTLVNPQGPVYASDIHGITDEDVVGAPFFSEIADDITEALKGAVVGAYNASFDLAFLRDELSRAGAFVAGVPFVCLMYLRPLLDFGDRCDLASACDELALSAGDHQAADDAMSEAYLWMAYRDAARTRGIETFGQLAQLKSYKFTKSFGTAPLAESLPPVKGTAPKPRTNPFDLEMPEPWPTTEVIQHLLRGRLGGAPLVSAEPVRMPKAATRHSARRIYWHALVDVTDDLEATTNEREFLASLRDRHGLSFDEVRALHARLFAERLLEMSRDEAFSDDEATRITKLASVLSQLGWSPSVEIPSAVPDLAGPPSQAPVVS